MTLSGHRYVLVPVLLLVTLAGCTAKPAPSTAASVTVWQKVMTMAGPNGQVSQEMALKLFAATFGPVPGVSLPEGPAGPSHSGTSAMKWVYAHWASLTADQKTAVDKYVGEPPSSRTAQTSTAAPSAKAAPVSPAPSMESGIAGESCPNWPTDQDRGRIVRTPDETLRLKAIDELKELENRLPYKLNARLVVCRADRQLGITDAQARSYQLPDGRINCLITVYPAGDSGSAEHKRAVLIHELMHCMMHRIFGAPANQFDVKPPLWVDEGIPEWAAVEISGYGERWNNYLPAPSKRLVERSYDAFGFFYHVHNVRQDMWQRIGPITLASMTNDQPDSASAFMVAVTPDRDTVLDSLPSSFVREPGRGPTLASGVGVWDITGKGINDKGIIGARQSWPHGADLVNGSARDFGADAYQSIVSIADIKADVIQFSNDGKAFWGRFGPAGHDFPLLQAMSKTFCAKQGGCKCKDGSPPPVVMTDIPSGPAYIAITGGTAATVIHAQGIDINKFCQEKPKGAACPGRYKGERRNTDHTDGTAEKFMSADLQVQASGSITGTAARTVDTVTSSGSTSLEEFEWTISGNITAPMAAVTKASLVINGRSNLYDGVYSPDPYPAGTMTVTDCDHLVWITNMIGVPVGEQEPWTLTRIG